MNPNPFQKQILEIAVTQAERAYELDPIIEKAKFKNDFGVEGFTVSKGNYTVCSITGSNEIADWWNVNLNGKWIDFLLTKELYNGFEEAYKSSINTIWQTLIHTNPTHDNFNKRVFEILDLDRETNKQYIFTGHSGGSAIALLAALDVAEKGFPVHMVSIAQPKLGYIPEWRLNKLLSHTRIYHPFDPLIYLPIHCHPHYGDPFPVSWFSLFPHAMHRYKQAVMEKIRQGGHYADRLPQDKRGQM